MLSALFKYFQVLCMFKNLFQSWTGSPDNYFIFFVIYFRSVSLIWLLTGFVKFTPLDVEHLNPGH